MSACIPRTVIGLLAVAILCLTGCGDSSAPPATTITADTAMFIGKSFIVADEVMTFNLDGSLTVAGTNPTNQTWTINPTGQLIIYNTNKGTALFTFTAGDARTGFTGTREYSNGASGTVTFVPVPGNLPGLSFVRAINITVVNSSSTLHTLVYATLTGGEWATYPAPGTSLGAGQMLGLNNGADRPFESLGGSISLSPASGGQIVINWSWPYGSAVSAGVNTMSLTGLAVSYQMINQQTTNPTLQVMITTSSPFRE